MSTFNLVKEYLAELNLIKPSKITEEIGIEYDLGITGDDAPTFIEEFCGKFKIKSDAFRVDDYFALEGDVVTKYDYERGLRKKLTVGDLVKAVDSGKLV